MFQQASFNSFEFIFLFLPCFLIGFHLLKKSSNSNYSHYWLIVCSLFFYSWGNVSNLPILLSSLIFNYTIAQFIGPIDTQSSLRPRNLSRKFFLVLGIVLNVLFLSYYKYFSYLPLGISFFTIMQIMYLVDCYEGMLKPNTLREHALVVSFFPTVTIGPILRVKNVLMQFRETANKGISLEQLAPSIVLFSIGLFKKVVIADGFAIFADIGYGSPSTLSMFEGWVTSLSYTMQLYFDFSGYSDMAIAIAMALGIKIPINFNSPYKAKSVVEFWQRWHMSLTAFITTYLYTPITHSFKKITFKKAMLATLITMIIVGAWHGSTWGFLIFGALHGLGMVIYHCWQKKIKIKLPNFLAWALTFIYVNVAFIFFRAESIPDATAVLFSLINFESIMSLSIFNDALTFSPQNLPIFFSIMMGLIAISTGKNSNQIIEKFQFSTKELVLASFLMVISLIYLNSNVSTGFIYYAF
jgi:D-alanyl-lipoteichoic acid acyltransferase DltB (MBOAT superfamily)